MKKQQGRVNTFSPEISKTFQVPAFEQGRASFEDQVYTLKLPTILNLIAKPLA